MEKGTRPRTIKQQQFEYTYLFGAVCPSTGQTEAIIAPWTNKEVMIEHLALISKATPPERHAVIIMDGAGWHTTDTSAEFSNLTIIKLPPYSPELNPIEQVWSWLRQHKLANQAFTGYDDIVDKCSRAWCDFIAQVDLVKSLCSRAWIELVS